MFFRNASIGYYIKGKCFVFFSFLEVQKRRVKTEKWPLINYDVANLYILLVTHSNGTVVLEEEVVLVWASKSVVAPWTNCYTLM